MPAETRDVKVERSMELIPVLDTKDKPQSGLWYALAPRGEGPGVSVGHTCTYIPSPSNGEGTLLIVGGANPNGSFSDCHVLNLDNLEWGISEWQGLLPRYEHCSFVPVSSPNSLWVFGGAEQSANRNCVQFLQLTDSGSWRTVEVKGTPPSPRTYHSASACVGDKLFVFSGGEAGATPVSDPHLHVFDTVSCSWSQPDTKGRPPTARHGHVVVAVGSKIYIHGGLAGETLCDDMYCLDTSVMSWERVDVNGDVPPAVAAHSAASVGTNIYIFGGMTATGASNAMYRFQCEEKEWSLMKFEGDLPPNRLDHSMCIVPWCVRTDHSGGESEEQTATAERVNLCFVFGGMDTQGVIHQDCVVTVV